MTKVATELACIDICDHTLNTLLHYLVTCKMHSCLKLRSSIYGQSIGPMAGEGKAGPSRPVA